MPYYCYSDDSGQVHDRFFRMGEAPKSVTLEDGSVAVRCFRAEVAQLGTPAKTGWPIECVASGVNAAQADDLRKFFVERGCPTEVSPDGNPIYTSAAHRRKALKVRGFKDRSSFC